MYNSYSRESLAEPRSSFLTWLCILTFIGSGWALLSCAWSYSTASEYETIFIDKQQKKKEASGEVRLQKTENGLEAKINRSFSKILKKENIEKASAGGFISSLLTLGGALFMWRQRKAGFFIYAAGIAFGIFIPFYLFGNDFIAVGFSAFPNFIGLVFVALYALNFNELKWKPLAAT